MTKSLKNVNLSDNFLFCKVLSDKNVCKALLEEIMGIEITDLKYCDMEKTIEPDGKSKGIRIDVIVEDKDGNIYDIEMQNRNVGDIPLRSRYYQSVTDINHLDKGDVDYRKLPRTCIIFFTAFDLFGDGKMKHVFRYRDDEDRDLVLNDGTVRIFLSATATIANVSSDLQSFLRYLVNSTDEEAENSGSDLVKMVHKRVTHVKRDRKVMREYMTLKELLSDTAEEARREALKEGIEAGKREEKIETARKAKAAGFSVESIIEITDLSREEIEKL